MSAILMLGFAVVSQLHAPLSLWTVPASRPSNSIFLCAMACVGNFNCGGFFFNVSQVPHCKLVVDASVLGAEVTSPAGLVYRLLNYRDVYKIMESGVDRLTWESARRTCLNGGMELITHPKSMRERASLSLRSGNFFYIDMLRNANGNYTKWNTQEIIPESEIFEWLPGNPHGGNDECFGMSETPIVFYDYGCNRTDSPTTLFCIH
ncbi:C-type lectin-like [Trinorchestia longiramus]|nr:C-type lectin-like [Trinorchestia longiramus]